MFIKEQLIFDLRSFPAMGRNDYFVSKANADAVNWIDMWPNWPSLGLIVNGKRGSGKSHLAEVLKGVSKGKIVFAKNINKNNIAKLFKIKCIIIEDLELLKSENALFHLYNMCVENNNKIMITSNTPVTLINFKLLDLKSRLLSLPSVNINFPDDILLNNIIIKQFFDRGVKIDKEVVKFLLKRVDRSFDSIYDLVSKIDFKSVEKSRKITIPFVKKFIKD